MKPISSKINPGSGLPEYLLLDHKNDPVEGGISVRLFSITEPSILRAKPSTSYTLTLQRAFYRKLAPAYRSNPEMTIAVEPNHENEIVSGTDSIGDYNPGNLTGFFHYLRALYGGTRIHQPDNEDELHRSAFFDAPRNLLRGLGQIRFWKTASSGNGSNTTAFWCREESEPVTGNACWPDSRRK